MEEKEKEKVELQSFINNLMEKRVSALEEGQKETNNRLTRFEEKQDNMISLLTELKEENKSKNKQRDNNLNNGIMSVVTSVITGLVGYAVAFIYLNK